MQATELAPAGLGIAEGSLANGRVCCVLAAAADELLPAVRDRCAAAKAVGEPAFPEYKPPQVER